MRFLPHFFTPINPIWVGDLRTGIFFFFSKTTGDIRHFVFLRMLSVCAKKLPTQAERALKNCLRRLSMRKKIFSVHLAISMRS